MSELSPNYDQGPARRYNLRRDVLAPLLVISSAALSGCFGDGSETGAHRLKTPRSPGETQELAAKFGRGKHNFMLKIEPAADKGPGPHELIIGVNMDCAATDAASTIVSVAGVVSGFETYTCGLPQFDTIDIPPKDALNDADSLNIQVTTSRQNLRWVVSAATINSNKGG